MTFWDNVKKFAQPKGGCDAPQMTIVPLRLTELSDGTDYRPVLAQGEEAERIVKRILRRSHKMDGFENGTW